MEERRGSHTKKRRFYAGVPSGAEELLLNIWKASPAETETTCVSALISRLRKKLGDSAGIKAIYGGGYVLEI